MRIHWAFVVFAVIGTILLTWYLRTKNMDFLTPSGVEIVETEETSGLIDLSVVLQPKIKDQPKINRAIQQIKDPDKITPPKVKEITEFELGDLVASPGLDAYQNFARRESPDRLFELSSALRARGEFQRALLAFERVIDTSEADPNSRAEAAQGIAALTKNLPNWNIDPSNEMILNLHLGMAHKPSDHLRDVLQEVATRIRVSLQKIEYTSDAGYADGWLCQWDQLKTPKRIHQCLKINALLCICIVTVITACWMVRALFPA